MTRPMIRIHNTETDEIIDREMNDAEFAQFEIEVEIAKQNKAQVKAQAQAKATAEGKLAALGLTTDDLRALGL